MSIAAVRGIGVAVITSTSGVTVVGAFAAQQVALLDAEPVLLVDHGHPEARELDAPVDERVRADQRCRPSPSRRPVGDAPALGGARAVGEQRDAAPDARRAASPRLGDR